MSDKYFFEDKKPTNLKSPDDIATWVATCAALACSIQYSVDKPGETLITRTERNRQYITSGALIYKPIFDLTSRGVMVERGLIDIDEVDLGWIIAESLKREKDWHPSKMSTFGRLFLLGPISVAVGYLYSELSGEDFHLDVNELPEYTEIFLENSTPEDTVNIFKLLGNSAFQKDLSLLHFSPSLEETIEDILEDEINLSMFCQNQAEYDILFEEISKNYEFSIRVGYQAFLEAVNEGLSFSDAILHTFYTTLSHYPDSALYRKFGRIEALKIRQIAKDIIGAGSIFTDEGKNLIDDLHIYYEKQIGGIIAHSVDDITTTITFLGLLSGIKPD